MNCNTCNHCPYFHGKQPRNGWDLCLSPVWMEPNNAIVSTPDGQPCPAWEPRPAEGTSADVALVTFRNST